MNGYIWDASFAVSLLLASEGKMINAGFEGQSFGFLKEESVLADVNQNHLLGHTTSPRKAQY